MEKEERRVLGELIDYYGKNLEKYAKADHEYIFLEVFEGKVKEIFYDDENYLRKVCKELDEYVYFAAKLNKNVKDEKQTVIMVKSTKATLDAEIEDEKFIPYIRDQAKRSIKEVRHTLLDTA